MKEFSRSVYFSLNENRFSQRPLFPPTTIMRSFHDTVFFPQYRKKGVFTTHVILFPLKTKR